MIDVVFQMIIFFIVTIKMDESINEDIVLPEARQGPLYDNPNPRTLVIEVDRRGWLSIGAVQFTEKGLRQAINSGVRRGGPFPVMIRADHRAKHQDVRRVMDLCTEAGIWRINFAAIKEPKGSQ
jgi:biopolymer transport protein ExbD